MHICQFMNAPSHKGESHPTGKTSFKYKKRYKQRNTSEQSKRIINQKAINCLWSLQGSNVRLVHQEWEVPVSVCNVYECSTILKWIYGI